LLLSTGLDREDDAMRPILLLSAAEGVIVELAPA
jgi:hypothetical protein